MTKLMQWLFFGVLLFALWISLVTKKISSSFLDRYSTVIFYSPLISLFLFAVYAVIIVLWRVYKFNDCEEAALELKKQIEEAKADLESRGFRFETNTS